MREPGFDESLDSRAVRLFSQLRPRPGFEAQLWRQISASAPRKRVWTWPKGVWAPTVAGLAALAIVLGLMVRPGPSQVPTGAFGLLPAPAIGAAVELYPGASSIQVDTPGAPTPYFGPADLRIDASLVLKVPEALPVYRYTEPPPDAVAQLERQLGSGTLVLGTSQSGREPVFQVRAAPQPATAQPPAVGQAKSVALGYLFDHGVVADWASKVDVWYGARVAVVHVIREFRVPGLGFAPEVDASGTSAGADVEVDGSGQVKSAEAPVPTSLDSASYRSGSSAQVIQRVMGTSSPASTTSWPVPPVLLTHAQLVYVAVSAGDHGYFEPAWLLTGEFVAGGTTYEKRVLVSALAPTQLR